MRKIKVTICNHHDDSPLYVWSDLVIRKFRKVWSYMTLNVLTETRCHQTTQTPPKIHDLYL